jgi:hypothetical protein
MFALALAGCGTTPEPADRREIVETSSLGDTAVLTREAEVAALRDAILALGPGVDPEEAARAAQVAYDYTDVLVREYEIVDPPIIHNMKVNAGLKPRGLCWHWAEDIERRLKAENFETLQLHRAIANADRAFRIDHSTTIISRRGDSMFEGIVIDPWRTGGDLVWARTTEDKYPWEPQRAVLERKAERLARAQ